MKYTNSERLRWFIKNFLMIDDVAIDNNYRHETPKPGITVDVARLQRKLRPPNFYDDDDDDQVEVIIDLIDAAMQGKEFFPKEPEIFPDDD